MAEVPDHLVPQDGLTNTSIRFDALNVFHGDRTVRVTFGIYSGDNTRVTELFVDVPTADYPGGANGLIAEAHRRMTDILRQWLHMTDTIRQAYETQ